MSRYEIVDEPDVKPWGEKLIVDPIMILLAAMLVPLIWNPPYFGRFWLPFAWVALNGLALGSATLGRELGIMAIGGIAWLAIFFGIPELVRSGVIPFALEDVVPYMRTLLFATFFLTLYLAIVPQGLSYQLFDYVRQRRDG